MPHFKISESFTYKKIVHVKKVVDEIVWNIMTTAIMILTVLWTTDFNHFAVVIMFQPISSTPFFTCTLFYTWKIPCNLMRMGDGFCDFERNRCFWTTDRNHFAVFIIFQSLSSTAFFQHTVLILDSICKFKMSHYDSNCWRLISNILFLSWCYSRSLLRPSSRAQFFFYTR